MYHLIIPGNLSHIIVLKYCYVGASINHLEISPQFVNESGNTGSNVLTFGSTF